MSPNAPACYPLSFLITSASNASNAFLHSALLSLITSSGNWSPISDCFLSPIADSWFLSAILGGFLSAVLGHLLSLVASGSLLFVVFGGGSFSFVPFTSSQALFLTNIPSCARCFSLPSLPLFYSFLLSLLTLLAYNLALLIKKRWFNQVFITQRPIASIRQ